MKTTTLVTILIALAALSACRKESSSPAPADEQTWTYADTTFKAAFAEINTRYGYQISFRPAGAAGLDYGITLRFVEKPQDGRSYLVSKDTTVASQVKITLETGTLPGYSSIAEGKRVETFVREGKLSFTGEGIRLVRDTIPGLADTLTLRFKLTEF